MVAEIRPSKRSEDKVKAKKTKVKSSPAPAKTKDGDGSAESFVDRVKDIAVADDVGTTDDSSPDSKRHDVSQLGKVNNTFNTTT